MKKKIFFVVFILLIGVLFYSFYEPTYSKQNLDNESDSILVKKHLVALTQTPKFRNYQNIEQLDSIADYIKNDFEKYSDSTRFQEYKVNNVVYKNVITSFGTENKKRIIIGAHYDVCGDQQGADDNASGTVALLELARLLKDKKLDYRIDLVAYTLEEPPFFRTENMGSFVHAKYLKDNKIDVSGMISVEMIGYFNDSEGSQDYPLGIMSWFYGNKGDYITIVKRFGEGKFAKQFEKKFKKSGQITTKTFAGPKFMQGVDFSDHLNYWQLGYSAVMLTDTSFYRNKNYHETTDTLETLNIPKMCSVINALYWSILQMKDDSKEK